MNKRLLLLMLPIFWSCSCSNTDKGSVESWKGEILQAERDFSAMSEREGMQAAFLHFAAEDVVVDRGDELLFGKPALEEYMGSRPAGARDELLSWAADFADVSQSGDLGYTYGRYTYSYTDSTGTRVENRGVFHTVWKRQEDGSWRFVWD
jgi:ketosteroid isomerase-like protein